MNAVLSNDVITRIREQAAQRFAQLGWPTTRIEEWKYTNLTPLATLYASLGERGTVTMPSAGTDSQLTLKGLALAELVFVDGLFDAAASRLRSDDEVRAIQFSAAPAEMLEAHFARYADYEKHPLTALNTANAGDGAFVEVSGAVEGFVHLLFIGSDHHRSHPRNLIVAHRGSQLAIVETYTGTGTYFTNAVTEIVAEAGAVIDHTKVVRESPEAFHVGTVQLHEERSASVTSRSIAIGGALIRSEVNAALAGEGANLVLDGLFVGTGRQHIDNHTVIDHVKPHCESVELYKGVLDDAARGIFDGRIVVHEGAQKTVARQTNKNLLLSETAIVDSKPTLEIFNDDVKCNHGSTIGQLDEEALFYIRSRGIGESDARALLVHAFASEIVDRMKVAPVREQVRRALFESMPERLPERREKNR